MQMGYRKNIRYSDILICDILMISELFRMLLPWKRQYVDVFVFLELKSLTPTSFFEYFICVFLSVIKTRLKFL